MTTTISEAVSTGHGMTPTVASIPNRVDTASKKRRGRPREFPVEDVALVKRLARQYGHENMTERQIRENLWAYRATAALRLDPVDDSPDPRLTWLWSEQKGGARIGIMARLGRLVAEVEAMYLSLVIRSGTDLTEDEFRDRVYNELLPVALELCRIRPRARDAQKCIDAIWNADD